eukprot:GHVR01034423.1.p1 GENE.GHVR01034423.1~~GHVR01034423.1.p1  ORF type:complete len:347 (-),score=54.17 GHVR01034423.1:329-1369(-)
MNALSKRCPDYQCGCVVRMCTWKKFLSPDEYVKLNEFRVHRYVESATQLKWCPGTNCTSILLFDEALKFDCLGELSCDTCKHSFCPICSHTPHLPIPCDIVRLWISKSVNEADNVQWIFANTKMCPTCKGPIQKNGGCNHMTCKCGAHFCWVCGRDWASHNSANYNCNQYKEDPEASRKQMAREALERYAFYFERYSAHDHGEKIAKERTLSDVFIKMEALSNCLSFMEVADVRFMEDAVKQVITCRRLLKWTYAYGYFAELSSKDKAFFEFQQGQLERFLELLQEQIENVDIRKFLDEELTDNSELFNFKSHTTNTTAVVNGFFEKVAHFMRDEVIQTYDKVRDI